MPARVNIWTSLDRMGRLAASSIPASEACKEIDALAADAMAEIARVRSLLGHMRFMPNVNGLDAMLRGIRQQAAIGKKKNVADILVFIETGRSCFPGVEAEMNNLIRRWPHVVE